MTKDEVLDLKYDSAGLIPAVVQDSRTGAVLMVAWMNRESLAMTLERGYTHFWSRSRQKFWKKGETSGHVQKVRSVSADCDADTLLVQVEQTGPACHTNSYSCFFKPLQERGGDERGRAEILDAVYRRIMDRRSRRPEGSYVASLMEEGREAVSAKVTEEAGEVAEASGQQGPGELVAETADLWFHSLVLLGWHDVAPAEVFREHQLGAYAVRARDQHGLTVASLRQREQAAKAAEPGEDLGSPGSLHERLDSLDEFVAGVDVDAGIFVGKWFIAHFGVAYSARTI